MQKKHKYMNIITLLWVGSIIGLGLCGRGLYQVTIDEMLIYSIGSDTNGDHNAYNVERLLGFGANPNITNEYGVTPLMIAIASGKPRIIEVLLTHGADPNWAAKAGNAMLWARVKAASDPYTKPMVPRMVKMLQDAGAKEWAEPVYTTTR